MKYNILDLNDIINDLYNILLIYISWIEFLKLQLLKIITLKK